MRNFTDCFLQNIHIEQYFYHIIDTFLILLMCIHLIFLSTGSTRYSQEKNCLCQQEIIVYQVSLSIKILCFVHFIQLQQLDCLCKLLFMSFNIL